MPFKKVTGDKLVKAIKDGKYRELKTDIEDEIVEKVTKRISAKKEEILKGIRNKKGRKK